MVVQRGAATTIQVVTGPTFVGASRSGAIFTVAVASGLTQNEPLTVCLEGLSVLSSVPVLFWRAEL